MPVAVPSVIDAGLPGTSKERLFHLWLFEGGLSIERWYISPYIRQNWIRWMPYCSDTRRGMGTGDIFSLIKKHLEVSSAKWRPFCKGGDELTENYVIQDRVLMPRLNCICLATANYKYDHINTLRPRRNGHHFADDIFKLIFLNENCILIQFFPRVHLTIIQHWFR